MNPATPPVHHATGTFPAGDPDLTDFAGTAPLTFQQTNLLLNQNALRRRDAIDELDQAQTAEADDERDYRKAKIEAWGRAPTGPAAQRTAWVDAEVAGHRHARDISRARVKIAAAHIARLKDEQIDIMHRSKWSQLIDANGATG